MNAAQINRRLEKVTDGIAAAAEGGLVELAVEVMRMAQRLVPRLTGALAESAYVSITRNGQLEIGYGVDYAPDVHQSEGSGRMWLQQAVMAFTGETGLKHVAKSVEASSSSGFASVVSGDAAEFARSPRGD